MTAPGAARRVAVVRAGPLPDETANATQVVRMTEGYVASGLAASLFFIGGAHDRQHISDYYELNQVVDLRPLRSVVVPWRKHFRPQTFKDFPGAIHARVWSAYAAREVGRTRAVFCHVREPVVALALARSGAKTILELHEEPKSEFQRRLLRAAGRHQHVIAVVAVTELLRADLITLELVDASKTTTLHDGVDISRVRLNASRSAARQRLGLSSGSLVVYAGSFYENRGVTTLLDAAIIDRGGTQYVLVGGDSRNAARIESIVSRHSLDVRTVPRVPASELAWWLRAADVLVLPQTGRDVHTSRHASPMKLFEYMASGTPIVSSDLPSIREVLDDRSAVLVEPDSPTALLIGIRRLLNDPAGAADRSNAAAVRAEEYAWQKRAEALTRVAGF